jgi:hypothetical protein
MDPIIYANKANSNPFLNKPINNTPKNCVLIYLSGSFDVINLLHDRIKMIAKDEFILGKKTSNMAIIETDMKPSEIRDKLMSGVGEKAEIFVMSFDYIGYAGWLKSSNSVNVKSFFENR